MSVLENFKNIPRSPYGGATGLKCNFFLQICNEVPGEKKEGGLSPPQRATGPCRPPQGRQASGPARGAGVRQASGPTRGAGRPSCGRQGGPVAPTPHGRPGQAAYIRPPSHSLLSFDLKKSKKIQKKERGEKKGSGEALPNSALVIYR